MFNHEARWDRELPAEKGDTPGEALTVICLFDGQKILPRSFVRRGREVAIQKILFSWKNKKGREELLFFSVQTEAGVYEIVFSAARMAWRLTKLLGP